MDPSSVLTSDLGERSKSLVQKSPESRVLLYIRRRWRRDHRRIRDWEATGKRYGQFCALPSSLLDSSCRHNRQTSIPC